MIKNHGESGFLPDNESLRRVRALIDRAQIASTAERDNLNAGTCQYFYIEH